MSKKENPKRCIAETKKQVTRSNEQKFRIDLLKRFQKIDVYESSYTANKDNISKKLSVPLAQLSSWAKDFYIGFAGEKSIDECLDLAYELEYKSRSKIVKSLQEEEDNFSFDLATKVKKEFFNGKDNISLQEVSDFFFKNATSKEIQGKRVRGKEAIFERLLSCTFTGTLDIFVIPETEDEYWTISTHQLAWVQDKIYPYDQESVDVAKRQFSRGIKAYEFYHILRAYLYKWDRYCDYKPTKTK